MGKDLLINLYKAFNDLTFKKLHTLYCIVNLKTDNKLEHVCFVEMIIILDYS